MFRVETEAERDRWIENSDGEDGSSIESVTVGEAKRSRQRYESMREQSIVGCASTGNMGGRVSASNPIDPTRSIEPHNPRRNSSSNCDEDETGDHAA
jgi:hypothetical protein